MSLPVIAIIGRPNVGKSTLFNRLIGKRYAITSPIPGTTRDRIYHETELGAYRVILVDTGGMEFEKKKDIEADVQLQAKIAVEEANIIFFVLDGTEPLTSNDLDCARHLRKSRKPIILIANKADRKRIAEAVSELYELGLGEPVQISSIHNFGIAELEEALQKVLKKIGWKKEKPRNKKVINMAIVGKPNVGKSSLVNALLSKNRLIVSDKPGTTIDATDTPVKRDGKDYVLIDTAGLRRRGKVKGLERFGVMRALQAISRSDVTCLVLDWGTGIANQDMHVSEYVLESGKGLIILVNKADLMTDPHNDQTQFLAHMQRKMPYIPWAPVLFISTVSKKNIFKIFEMGRDIAEEMHKKIEDDLFNLFTKTTVLAHPPMRGGHNIIISKGQQTGTFPPTFTFFANKPDIIHFSYSRFLENEIRRKFGFYGTAIRVEFKLD